MTELNFALKIVFFPFYLAWRHMEWVDTRKPKNSYEKLDMLADKILIVVLALVLGTMPYFALGRDAYFLAIGNVSQATSDLPADLQMSALVWAAIALMEWLLRQLPTINRWFDINK